MEKTKGKLFSIQWFPEYLVASVSAAVARCTLLSLTFPLEYRATLKQVGEKVSFKNFKNYTTGFWPLFLRDVLFSSIMFTVRDNLRSAITKYDRHPASTGKTLLMNGFCGAMGGTAASLLTYPLDILKTRWQVIDSLKENPRRKGIVKDLREIYQKEGIESFYYGLGAKMSRSAIAGGLVIGLYEFFYQIIQDARNK
jgi:hypothetical protein